MEDIAEVKDNNEKKKKGGAGKIILFVALGIAVIALAVVGIVMITKPKGPTLTYLGHASVKIKTSAGTVIYIDPYCEEVSGAYKEPADIILVTHDHSDHSCVKLCKQNEGCTVITRKEALLNKTEYQTFEIDDVKIEAVVSGGNANHYITTCVGYIVTVDGVRVYHAGDCSFSDDIKEGMKDRNLDYAMYPTDGTYNMGPEEATEMADYIGAKVNIPIHGEFRDKFTANGTLLLEYGQKISLK